MRQSILLIALLLFIGCKAKPEPVLGTATVTVSTVIPKRLVLMPKLELSARIGDRTTSQHCWTNWRQNICRITASGPVRGDDDVTIKVEGNIFTILEKSIPVGGPPVSETSSVEGIDITVSMTVTPHA